MGQGQNGLSGIGTYMFKVYCHGNMISKIYSHDILTCGFQNQTYQLPNWFPCQLNLKIIANIACQYSANRGLQMT